MNPIFDIIFTITWVGALVYAIRMMADVATSKPVRDYNAGRLTGEWTTQVKKPVHPEMQDVKPGEQLMGVTFKSKEVTECDLEEYKDLQARIDALRIQLEDQLDDDEEDDDGGSAVVRR